MDPSTSGARLFTEHLVRVYLGAEAAAAQVPGAANHGAVPATTTSARLTTPEALPATAHRGAAKPARVTRKRAAPRRGDQPACGPGSAGAAPQQHGASYVTTLRGHVLAFA